MLEMGPRAPKYREWRNLREELGTPLPQHCPAGRMRFVTIADGSAWCKQVLLAAFLWNIQAEFVNWCRNAEVGAQVQEAATFCLKDGKISAVPL